MTKTLHTTLVPLLIVGSVCSLNWFEYPLGQPRPYLSCLYTLTTWGYFTYSFYYEYYITLWDNNILMWMDMIIVFAAIGSIAASNFYLTELKMCLHELSVVDDTLEALGAPKKYQRLHNWIIRIIIGWIVYIFLCITMELLGYWSLNIINIININFVYKTFMENHSKFVIILSALIWGIILRYTCSRFHHVNDRLEVLYTDLFENNADRRQNRCILIHQRITEVEDCKQYIWVIMHVHLKLCLISCKLNNIFNIQMLLQMIWNFLENVLFYIQISGIFIEKDIKMKIWAFNIICEWLYTIYFFIMHNALFLTLNYICQIVYCKINKTVAILHELSNYNFEEDLDKEILQFILQIKLREVKFGMGQFHFGYNFIRQFYATGLAFLMTLKSLDLTNF